MNEKNEPLTNNATNQSHINVTVPLSYSRDISHSPLKTRDYILWAIVLIVILSLVVLLLPVLMPFIAAAIAAYIFEPLVVRLNKYKISRSLSALLILLTLFLLSLGLISLLLPLITQELIPLLERSSDLPIYLNKILSKYFPTIAWQEYLNPEYFSAVILQNKSTFFSIISSIQKSLISGGGNFLNILVNAILFPVALFYFIISWPNFAENVRSLLPPLFRTKVLTILTEIDKVLDEYFHGQFLVIISLSTFYAITLIAIGFPNGFSLGILIGLLSFLPYIGFSLGFGLCLFIAIIHSDSTLIIGVLVIFSVGQLLESYILTPFLVGERIGLHPLTVMFAIIAFGSLLGFVGVLLALPTSAIILVLLRHLKNYYHQSKFYKLS